MNPDNTKLDAVNALMHMRGDEFNDHASEILQKTDGTADEAFTLLYGLADDVTAIASRAAVCARGCAHCCHIAVVITNIEAQVIARRLGIEARTVPHREDFTDFPYGYSKPCTFLKGGECSIYDARPMPCRSQLSGADSPKPCELTQEARGGKVPYINLRQFDLMAVAIAANYATDALTLGELRDFFPDGTGDKA